MKEDSQLSCLENIKLFLKYFQMTLKIMLQYKFDRAMLSIAVFIREIAGVIVIVLLLTRFVMIKGWQKDEILFLYSFLFLSYSIFVFFFTGIRDFEDLVYSGELDRYLVRPVGILFQVIASKVDYTAALGHGSLGIILFYKTSGSLGIEWDFKNSVFYILMLIGGAIIQASIFMVSSCLSFWTIKTTNLRNMLFFNSRRFAAYPLSFYPGIIQKLLIFVVPFAFVNYFPSQYFLKKPEMQIFWKGFIYLNPVIAIIMFVIIYIFWGYGLKRYSSTGNSLY